MRNHWLSLAAVLVAVCAASDMSAKGSTYQSRRDTAVSVSDARPTLEAQTVLDRYCSGCHNDRLKTGGLSLSPLNVGRVAEHAEEWEKVVTKLRARFMPPVGRPRPDEATYDRLIAYLETSLDRAAAVAPNPGRTDALQRLNRTEYHNAVRDLLALDVDVSSLLPKDDSNYGFDNVSLPGLSTTGLDRYVSAANKISQLAVGSPVRFPGAMTVVVPPDRTQDYHVDGLPLGTRGGVVFSYNFPRAGEYEIQLRLSRDRSETIEGFYEGHQCELSLDGAQIQVFDVEPKGGPRTRAQEHVDEAMKVRIPVTAGPHKIGATFLKKPLALLETERQQPQAHFNRDRHPRLELALYSVAITGPYNQGGVGETPSRQRIFVCRPAKASDEEACAKTILTRLTRRAYRRPVTDADLQVPLHFYEEGRVEGGFEGGIEEALQSILVSPEFLFRVARVPANLPQDTTYRVSDLELASRLSFFLWSSIPDEELLEVASREKLHEPAVLDRQVKRMLADQRASALVTNFAGQWLQVRNLEAQTPDPRLLMDFDDNLRQAFRQETDMFFESIVKEDRSVIELLTASYTFLNERLAKHYGIPHIYGSRFRRVTLDPATMRGGLLGQGSILTVSSQPNRTSPVFRGKWVLQNLLGADPPPPPPNVPPLKDSKGSGGKVLSMRERMAQHRSNPVCASCHSLMDPIGLSMENFDAIGHWRTRDETEQPIDASGSLPDGTKYDGVAGLKAAVLRHPEAFAAVVTQRLLTYGLGRGLRYYDAPAVRSIVREASRHDFRFSSLVQAIVTSTPFQMRRS